MPSFNIHPDSFVDLNDLFPILNDKVGLSADQFRKVVENIYWNNDHLSQANIKVGTINVTYAPPGSAFDVKVTHRGTYDDHGCLIEDILDFDFTMAATKIEPTASATLSDSPDDVNASVTAVQLEDLTGYKFNFAFVIPRGKQGVKGISFRNRGSYSEFSSYVNDDTWIDFVYYKGSLYCPNVEKTTPGVLPTEATEWTVMVSKGDKGDSIKKIERTGTDGLVDTYTVTFDNGDTFEFTVTNGSGRTNVFVNGEIVERLELKEDPQKQIDDTNTKLTEEVERAQKAEQANKDAIDAEAKRAQDAEQALEEKKADKTAIPTKTGQLENTGDGTQSGGKVDPYVKNSQLNSEITNRQNADKTINSRIDKIEEKIPEQASADDKLATQGFVNSSIQTATADFRGAYANYAAVPENADAYPEDEVQNKTPNKNDYVTVLDASDYPDDTLEGSWRFKYSGSWEVDGKNGWKPECRMNETSFTDAQLNALNSGVTENLVKETTLRNTYITPDLEEDGSGVAVGSACTTQNGGFAAGFGSHAFNNSVAIGDEVVASDNSVAVGNGSSAQNGGVAVGKGADASAGGVQIGEGANIQGGKTVQFYDDNIYDARSHTMSSNTMFTYRLMIGDPSSAHGLGAVLFTCETDETYENSIVHIAGGKLDVEGLLLNGKEFGEGIEMLENKVVEIADADKESEIKYPSVKAVVSYVDKLLGEIAGALSEV